MAALLAAVPHSFHGDLLRLHCRIVYLGPRTAMPRVLRTRTSGAVAAVCRRCISRLHPCMSAPASFLRAFPAAQA
jgi:hypothetical protein